MSDEFKNTYKVRFGVFLMGFICLYFYFVFVLLVGLFCFGWLVVVCACVHTCMFCFWLVCVSCLFIIVQSNCGLTSNKLQQNVSQLDMLQEAPKNNILKVH